MIKISHICLGGSVQAGSVEDPPVLIVVVGGSSPDITGTVSEPSQIYYTYHLNDFPDNYSNEHSNGIVEENFVVPPGYLLHLEVYAISDSTGLKSLTYSGAYQG